MGDKTSVIKILGLPEAFTAVLLIIGLILSLAPYFSGADFGLFKIPQFTDPARKKLKIVGPVIFLGFVTLFLPLMNRNSSNANRNVANDNRNQIITTNDNRPASSIEIHNQAQQHIARARDLYKQAKYEDAIKECDAAIALEPANQEALDLKEKIKVSLSISNEK